ncbi:hypothetical protein [Mesorhizobium sp. YM1C-6-2]|uniref:hypothetical protein n=1 Tax=Mesorhizobium sp. YM1C-6-2 TaxID=1827501 RepID=UPI001FE1EA10|nr:hypothetical protein [Mesorhizobium sp. YM1C-6-2]
MDKTVPAGAAMLLDFIGGIEAPRGYDTIYGNNQGKLPKPVTSMTLAEVQSEQGSWTKRFGSSATGRYQFMKATLSGLIAELGLSPSQKLDANLQDRLGYHLLKRRGYEAFVAGKISAAEFGKRLAQEWASLPVLVDTQGASRRVRRGQSYYAGDGLNKSLIAPEKVETVLALARDAARKPVGASKPVEPSSTPPAAKPALPTGPVVVHVEDRPPAVKPGPAPKQPEALWWRIVQTVLGWIFGPPKEK